MTQCALLPGASHAAEPSKGSPRWPYNPGNEQPLQVLGEATAQTTAHSLVAILHALLSPRLRSIFLEKEPDHESCVGCEVHAWTMHVGTTLAPAVQHLSRSGHARDMRWEPFAVHHQRCAFL